MKQLSQVRVAQIILGSVFMFDYIMLDQVILGFVGLCSNIQKMYGKFNLNYILGSWVREVWWAKAQSRLWLLGCLEIKSISKDRV